MKPLPSFIIIGAVFLIGLFLGSRCNPTKIVEREVVVTDTIMYPVHQPLPEPEVVYRTRRIPIEDRDAIDSLIRVLRSQETECALEASKALSELLLAEAKAMENKAPEIILPPQKLNSYSDIKTGSNYTVKWNAIVDGTLDSMELNVIIDQQKVPDSSEKLSVWGGVGGAYGFDGIKVDLPLSIELQKNRTSIQGQVFPLNRAAAITYKRRF